MSEEMHLCELGFSDDQRGDLTRPTIKEAVGSDIVEKGRSQC